LPSCLSSPDGSLIAGIPAAPKARQMMSFRTWCFAILPSAFLHTMAWRPWASTKVPQWQLCGTHKLSPSRIMTAIRTASSSCYYQNLRIERHPYTKSRIENIRGLWLKWRGSAQGWSFWGLGRWVASFGGMYPKTQKGAWIGIFKPN